MRFGSVRLEDAQDGILAHALKAGETRLPKGHRITRNDQMMLSAAGVQSLTVARLDDGDIPEDDAAATIAAALTSGGLRSAGASTGRVYIHSSVAGLFVANRNAVDRLNRLDPAITLACLADHVSVQPGEVVATVKMIPFAVPLRLVEQVRELSSVAMPFVVKPYMPHRTALIATTLPSLKEQLLDKTRRIFSERLTRCGSTLDREWRVEHNEEEIAAAVTAAGRGYDLIIIFGASAVSDAADVVPSAIRRAGGVVEHIGMPVDPGNLLLLARIRGVPVIGAPGCARGLRENGMDFVLNRILAGEHPTSWDITGLGVGGLLKGSLR